MGHNPDDPVLDPNKVYKVKVGIYQGPNPIPCHEDNYVQDHICCAGGSDLLDWQKFDWWCEFGKELCVFSGFTAQKLIDIMGQYDTFQECRDSI